MTKNYELIKAEYIKFLASPDKSKTNEEWAKEKGVHPSTLSDWKRDPEFKRRLTKEVESQLSDAIPEIYQALRKRAKAGDISAINLILKQLEILRSDKQEHTHSVDMQPFNELVSEFKKEIDEGKQRRRIKEAKVYEGDVAK